ncbi:class I SAM-dependent methyltransferase [Streptomyces sp. PTM05]|uniref:Class I SAM-dependent methyltransferase n=1 Tax=Streptantibioticus parmotrematis TaxID=2873249 RepID=A0ABS7QPI2_9ACTN|nr:class I SAM-dependent methyltransferase [Streptantibioticus parmotrematis]MBY8885096.1 class I SAM-dependent methyltransferase [Streptantibioticus parmotrematis]
MPRTAAHGGGHRVTRFARALAADPVEALSYLPEEAARHWEHPVDHTVDPAWERDLHRLLGAPWPCPERVGADREWDAVVAGMRARGLAFGRHTYGHYSDADRSLARAVWCAVRHTTPDVVVETGVARGVVTRFALTALAVNGNGHLWSVDLPHPFEPALHAQTGAAVPGRLRDRWSYVPGSSRRRLPGLTRRLGRVDLFVHDSLHTARNTRFEMDRVARVLAPGGVMLVDDISTHQGFAEWAEDAGGAAETLVCPSADGEGLFGVVRRV